MAPIPPRERWEYDPAHLACQRWIEAWRRQHPDHDQPPLRFAKHLGQCALTLSEGVDKVELTRLFSAAGYDGACPCGELPGTADRHELEALAS